MASLTEKPTLFQNWKNLFPNFPFVERLSYLADAYFYQVNRQRHVPGAKTMTPTQIQGLQVCFSLSISLTALMPLLWWALPNRKATV